MRFLNYIINIPNKAMGDLFPEIQKNKEMTLANQFIEDIENVFSLIESKHSVYQLKSYNPNTSSHEFQLDGKQDTYSPEQQQEYSEKVKGYTEQKIGRKIQQSILPYMES